MGKNKLLSIVLLASLTPASTVPAQDAKEKFAAAQKGNAAAMRQYTWKSRTELKLKGEPKSIKLEQVRYDVNGQLQKTPLDSGAPQQQQQSGGGRGGRLKAKIIEKKKEEFGDMIKGLAGLVTSYAHLPQGKMQSFIQNASFKPGQGQDAGTIEVTGQPGVVPGDSMSMWVDQSTMLFRRVTINTVYDKKPVSVACTYATTPSGLNYMAKAVLDYPSEKVQVTVDNYEYQSSMSGGSAPAQSPARQSGQQTTQQAALAKDSGWPRQTLNQGNRLITYQPQVDDWKDFQELQGRMAFSLTPAGGKAVVGVVALHAYTDVDTDQHIVLLSNLQITKTDFPSLDPDSAAKMDKLVMTFLPKSYTISLERLTACVPKAESAPTVTLKNDPPAIFVSHSPAILLFVDGQPVRAAIKNTKLEFVVNTSWPLFFDQTGSKFYLLLDQQWLTADKLDGKWSATARLPKEMSALPKDPEWTSLAKVIPPANTSAAAQSVFYSTRPAEVILFDGKPVFSRISGTQLLYASNTSSSVFMDGSTNLVYYLSAGRWFRANTLGGPWSYATPDLPADFARIPPGTPASRVLSSVPGTDEAKDAVLLAQVPTIMVVDPATPAKQSSAEDKEPVPEKKLPNPITSFFGAQSSKAAVSTPYPNRNNVALGKRAQSQTQPAASSQPQAAPAQGAEGGADLAKQLSNPIASLISLPFQMNWDTSVGPERKTRTTLNIQPVMPFKMNENWNFIARLIMPLVSQPPLAPGGETKFGMSDFLFSGFISPAKSKFVWGVGPALLVPVTSDPALGTGKVALGPTIVVLKQIGGATIGALANHLWSIGGDDNRPAVNQTFIQPFLSYTTKTAWTYSINSELSLNWKAKDGDEVTAPINFGITKLVRLGKQPISLGPTVGYFVDQPSIGPKWKARFALTLLFPIAK